MATLPESVVSTACPHGESAVLLVCEHASRFIPEGLSELGLAEAAAHSHIAWDPGALAVAQQLSSALDATLIAQKISRLVYDCNRPPESDQAMRAESEVYNIPGNTGLTAAQRAERTDYIYRPFQRALSEAVKTRPQSVLVTIHSFTPVYNDAHRTVEVGILHDSDSRLADAMLNAAAKNPAFKVERNEPYGPEDGVTHTLVEHALPRGLLNVMIEVRNDLLADAAGVEAIATWLESLLTSALNQLEGAA
ncbi:MAG: N-formylglutamate amidohydrolase [Rhodobacteraceae bacterium]|nr:N-formylglutamate amidohydrolase [Paracoccaceae bacterium]